MKEYEKLAKTLVHHSCKLKNGEKVLIEQSCVDPEFIRVLIREIKKAGAMPFVNNFIPEISKELLIGMTEEYAKLKTEFDLPIMKQMDAYISISGFNNMFEKSDVPSAFTQIYSKHYVVKVHYDERVNHTKWVILNWPNPAISQSAGMSTDAFRDLYFKVCTLNYEKMDKAMTALKFLMERTDKVRIVAPNTDLTFSIKNIPAIKCSGENNIPDGEVFTAPIKTSINGKINYNIPTIYNGIKFENIFLEIENGKIITATAGDKTKKLNEILDTDEGARYFGEFAFGVNPYITTPMLDILFDEKMCGSIHLTPGASYEEAPNGNESSIHWDMVLCQSVEYGGGEIYFDNVLIRKDGKFVLPELLPLNPENLV